jgi:N utilization substance protein B
MNAAGRSPGQRRSAARLACVQALYEMDVSGADSDPVLQAFLAERWRRLENGTELPEADNRFLTELVTGISAKRKRIDRLLAPLLPAGRDLERLEVLLRAILRAGAYELDERPDIPSKVVINEYVEVTHAFFAGKEPGLINAVLDRLARQLRSGETPAERHGDDGQIE